MASLGTYYYYLFKCMTLFTGIAGMVISIGTKIKVYVAIANVLIVIYIFLFLKLSPLWFIIYFLFLFIKDIYTKG
jgi:hypothetical protein